MSAIRRKNRHFYEFGPFRLDAVERLLFRDDEVVPLAPKVIDTLVVLIEQRGHLVAKDELMKSLWPDTFVEESNLAQNISVLRKALGEEHGAHQYIETLPKRGYRFVAEVKEVQDQTAAFLLHRLENTKPDTEHDEEVSERFLATVVKRERSPGIRGFSKPQLAVVIGFCVIALIGAAYLIQARWNGGPATTPRSIAVLPFKTFDSDNDSAGLGMADALILRLARQNQLLVLPTSSIFKYTKRDADARSIGRQLGVDAVLDGTIQRSGERLRVTAHLIRVADNATLWTGKFDQQVNDIFVVQDAVSEQLAQALTLTIIRPDPKLRKPYTENPEAYELYIAGLSFWNKRTEEGLTKAIDYFNRAIEKDPDFALAYTSLSDSHMLIGHYRFSNQSPRDVLPKVKAAALRAFEIDPNLAEAHAAMAVVNAVEGDYPHAIKLYERAIELNPNLATARLRYGYLLAHVGRLDEAISHMQRAHDLDPLSSTVNVNLSAYYGLKQNWDLSVKHARMALELNPEAWQARLNLGEALEAKGLYQEAETEYRKLEEQGQPLVSKQQMAYLYAATGRKDEARALLAELEKAYEEARALNTTEYQIALVYMALGQPEQSLEWLERAFNSRTIISTDFRYGHKFNSLRSDPRFQALQQRVQDRLKATQDSVAREKRQALR
ncbi:MAG TPA: tetratricopeptide repeat protein [Pyrinomonadaceae bacterium]|nr:tetratricopeptide repeat protein [Pyrinomonadaceae bacterium]